MRGGDVTGSPLEGRTVVLGVAGGIAAYKAVEVLRLLTDAGAEVHCVLTPEATRFVAPLTFTALSGRQCLVELWDTDDPIPHTRLGQRAELVVVAPATAHLLGRVANGLADDLLTNVILATRAPVLLATAMHTEMWEQPSVVRNVARLRADGVHVLDPESGPLAGGDVGRGRLAAPERIVEACRRVLDEDPDEYPDDDPDDDLAGRRILVTAGGTREPIDAVRYVGNRSTGKMGVAIAREAAARGAEVTLVSTVGGPDTYGVRTVDVETAAEMADAVFGAVESVDAVVMAAAVADFTPEDPVRHKLKKDAGAPEVRLVPTTDIVAELGRRRAAAPVGEGRRPVLIGFAAETEDPERHGVDKAVRKQLDCVVANVVGVPDSGFGADTNRAWLCRPDGDVDDLGTVTKTDLAAAICGVIARSLAGAN